MPLGMRYPLACGFMGLLQTDTKKRRGGPDADLALKKGPKVDVRGTQFEW